MSASYLSTCRNHDIQPTEASFCPVLIAGVPKTNVWHWHDFCNLLHCGDLLTDPARKLACLSDYRARSESVLETVIQDLRFVHGYNSFFNDVFIPIAQYDIPLFYERGVGDGTLRAGPLSSIRSWHCDMNDVSFTI